PVLGSAVVQLASWRWAFLLNLPLGAYTLAVSARRLEESRAKEIGSFPDALGTALLIAAFSSLAYGIVGGRAHPGSAASALAAGLVLLALFVRRSLRAETPALDLRLFARRSFAIANAMTLLFSIAFSAMFFGNVFFLTERWQLPIVEAGLWISPGP